MSRSLLELLSWDSRFFGRRIARVAAERLKRSDVPVLLTQSVQQQVDCLYFLADGRDMDSWRAAEAAGFGLMDIRVTFEREVGTAIALTVPPQALRFARARRPDVRALQKMASGLYKDSRFAVDPTFPRDAAPRLFREWVSRSVDGRFDDAVWIARSGKEAAGFISCRRGRKDKPASIGLVGVSPRSQGRGIGVFLIQEALDWFRQQGSARVQVVTQGSNIAAQRLYEKCGFRIARIDLWYHKWFPQKTSR